MAKAQQYISDLAAGGRYHFSTADMAKTLGISHNAARLSLYRLAKHGLVASPARGFYVVIPPEYRSLGSLPADQFLPALMEWRKIPYYAGLLTAAQYHGAAHHRPQVFQAMVVKNERPIDLGSVRVRFIARKGLRRVSVQSFNTPRGTIKVSTAEATAIDLAGYPQHAGGLDQVATVLSELAEKIDAKRLVLAARSAPLPWAQRLGYLLELVGAKEQAHALKEYVHRHARDWAALVPGVRRGRARRALDWLLYVNARVEPEV
jgi:predicted transcriptional regulator of viral defense system